MVGILNCILYTLDRGKKQKPHSVHLVEKQKRFEGCVYIGVYLKCAYLLRIKKKTHNEWVKKQKIRP